MKKQRRNDKMKAKHEKISTYTLSLILAVGLLAASLAVSCTGEGEQTGAAVQTEPADQSKPGTDAQATAAVQPQAAAPGGAAAETKAVTPDLSVPPPGSPATQEKWDGFDEAKKKEAWAKYMAENPAAPSAASGQSPSSADTTAPAAGTTAAAVEQTAPASKSSKVSVVAGKLTRSPITLYYYGLGELEAGRIRKVSPLTTGVVASLYVSEGDFVEAGDLLFSLDDSDLVRDIEVASERWNAELELVRIRLNETQTDYETAESLYSRDLISRAEYDGAKKAWEETKIAYEKVRLAKAAELEKLQENLRTGVSISPGRGYVSQISFLEGEQVNSADFVEIVDIEEVVISIRVPENIITRIRTGNQVLAKQASAPDYLLEGKVVSKGVVSDGNRTYEVRVRVDNPDQRLLPGMLMETQVRIARMTDNFVIPKESILRDGSDQFIFLLEGNIAKRIPVTTGQSRGNLIQINGAVEEGDLFVLQGQSYLREGIEVNITETREYLPESREL
jgi:RND family efflux transporter MFP subunit